MKAGTLNNRITIQRRTGGEDAWGAPLPAGWEDVAQVWANVRHVSGSEMIRADADGSKVKASIRIRWRCGIDAGMRGRGRSMAAIATITACSRRGISIWFAKQA